MYFFLISNLNKPISINWLLFYKNFYFPWHKLSIKTPRITALFPYKRGNPCICCPSAQSGSMSAEEFHSALQEATNFPLRGFVLPYLKHTLPALQRDLSAAARAGNQVSTKKKSNKALMKLPLSNTRTLCYVLCIGELQRKSLSAMYV